MLVKVAPGVEAWIFGESQVNTMAANGAGSLRRKVANSHGIDWNICKQFTLQWRHNERDGVSNHRHLDYLLNRLFRRRSEKTSKPVTGEFPTYTTGQ